jgi:cytochrome bd-type quinol oxidase subunit 2
METKKFKKITKIYLVFLVIALTIYFYLKLENGTINVAEERMNIIIIMALSLIGMVMAGIVMTAIKKNENYIDKKSVYGGISIAVIFLLWRLAINFFLVFIICFFELYKFIVIRRIFRRIFCMKKVIGKGYSLVNI